MPVVHGACVADEAPTVPAVEQNQPPEQRPVGTLRPCVAQKDPPVHASCTLMARKGHTEPVGQMVMAAAGCAQ